MPAQTPNLAPQDTLPQGRLGDFLRTAQQNMEQYGNTPYEIGSLILNHVVDQETRQMAYQIREDHLGNGSSAAAFLVRAAGEAQDDVLTASYTPAVATTHELSRAAWVQETDERLEALRRAEGLAGHVQLKAADREHGLVITTKAPGKGIFQHDGPIEPTDEHWKQLQRTAKSMRRRRIGFDEAGGNIHWDPKEGFTIFDTHPVGFNPRRWVRPRQLARAVQRRVDIQNRPPSNGFTEM